jgi:hypothetical protein
MTSTPACNIAVLISLVKSFIVQAPGKCVKAVKQAREHFKPSLIFADKLRTSMRRGLNGEKLLSFIF